MAKKPYKIEVDEKNLIVKLRLDGIWSVETLENYTKDVQYVFTRARSAGMPSEEYGILIDLREHGVQPREVAQRIQEQLANGVSQASRHAVLLSESALHKIQAQRVGSHLDAFFSADETEAMDWLLAGD